MSRNALSMTCNLATGSWVLPIFERRSKIHYWETVALDGMESDISDKDQCYKLPVENYEEYTTDAPTQQQRSTNPRGGSRTAGNRSVWCISKRRIRQPTKSKRAELNGKSGKSVGRTARGDGGFEVCTYTMVNLSHDELKKLGAHGR